MIFPRKRIKRTGNDDLYQTVMAGALNRQLYLGNIARDTFEGRFHMVALHSALVMRQLRRFETAGRELSDHLYGSIFSGFDYALREDGAGDATIAKKNRRLGEAFYGLERAFDNALDSQDQRNEVMQVLLRNEIGADHADQLVEYLLAAEIELGVLEEITVCTGAFHWPEIL